MLENDLIWEELQGIKRFSFNTFLRGLNVRAYGTKSNSINPLNFIRYILFKGVMKRKNLYFLMVINLCLASLLFLPKLGRCADQEMGYDSDEIYPFALFNITKSDSEHSFSFKLTVNGAPGTDYNLWIYVGCEVSYGSSIQDRGEFKINESSTIITVQDLPSESYLKNANYVVVIVHIMDVYSPSNARDLNPNIVKSGEKVKKLDGDLFAEKDTSMSEQSYQYLKLTKSTPEQLVSIVHFLSSTADNESPPNMELYDANGNHIMTYYLTRYGKFMAVINWKLSAGTYYLKQGMGGSGRTIGNTDFKLWSYGLDSVEIVDKSVMESFSEVEIDGMSFELLTISLIIGLIGAIAIIQRKRSNYR